MEDKSKLYVFDKKEVALIFIFMILISITCFTLGVRVGKNLAFEKSGYTEKDKEVVELKSNEEEYADNLASNSSDLPKPLEKSEEDNMTDKEDESLGRLKDELNHFSGPQSGQAPNMDLAQTNMTKKDDSSSTKNSDSKVSNSGDDLRGKFTVQLGSFKTIDEAKDFADAFTVRGHNPIINEVSIAGQGMWYRVSLGVFNTIDEARAFVQKEKELFKAEEYKQYMIRQIE